MTIQDRIEAIITDGTIMAVEDLPERVYVGDSIGVPTDGCNIAGTMANKIFFNVDAMAKVEDRQFEFLVKHELMHQKYARLPRATGLVTVLDPKNDWDRAAIGIIDAAIASGVKSDWDHASDAIINAGIAPAPKSTMI